MELPLVKERENTTSAIFGSPSLAFSWCYKKRIISNIINQAPKGLRRKHEWLHYRGVRIKASELVSGLAFPGRIVLSLIERCPYKVVRLSLVPSLLRLLRTSYVSTYLSTHVKITRQWKSTLIGLFTQVCIKSIPARE